VLKQERSAETAEALMRSRFTAHAIGDYRHLHRTYLPTSRQPYVEEEKGGDVRWTRLVVHAHEPGAKPGTAFVDFSAYFEDGAGGEQPMHEKSEFSQIGGQWYFARTVRSGPAPVKSTAPKVGRNEPCPCGSGKKFKHCCGR
jgi:SEC-C motif-containing protein